METPDGTVQGYIHYNGNTQIKDGDIVIDSIGEESGLNFEEVTKMSCKGLSSVMYNGLKDSADANFLHSAALTEGMLILRDSNGNVGTLDAQILKTILGRFDTTNGYLVSDIEVKPRGSVGDNGHIKFPSGNNGLTGWIGSCNNTLRMYGFNASGTYKDAFLELATGSFYATGGIKAKGGDVSNSSGQSIGGAYAKLPKFYSKSGANVSLPNSSFVNVATYTAPSAGYALVSIGGLFPSLSNTVLRRIAGLLLAGAEFMNFETTTASTARLWASGSIVIPCSKGQVITGRFYQNSGAAKTLEQWKFGVIFFPN